MASQQDCNTYNEDAAVHWRVFQLNPMMPKGGMDRRTYLSMKFGGPENAGVIYERILRARVQQVIREALARGADRALHVDDNALVAADAFVIADALAAAMAEEQFDLVLTGLQSDDQGHAQVGVILAERL
ncbi:MAG TPA: hypothetical protein VLB84_12635, partial [Bacteroidia bacterium]|nr:hypothetical protein [Bacteroidia bacterium]